MFKDLIDKKFKSESLIRELKIRNSNLEEVSDSFKVSFEIEDNYLNVYCQITLHFLFNARYKCFLLKTRLSVPCSP